MTIVMSTWTCPLFAAFYGYLTLFMQIFSCIQSHLLRWESCNPLMHPSDLDRFCKILISKFVWLNICVKVCVNFLWHNLIVQDFVSKIVVTIFQPKYFCLSFLCPNFLVQFWGNLSFTSTQCWRLIKILIDCRSAIIAVGERTITIRAKIIAVVAKIIVVRARA